MTPISLPQGFRYAGFCAGIKPSGKKDIAIIVTDHPAVAVGVYTQNVVRACSIDWNRKITPTDKIRGLVINSGNANACTGELGVTHNFQMAKKLADMTSVAPEQVAILSTGVIGHPLPIEKVMVGIETAWEHLGDSHDDFMAAANAILTTDNGPKTATKQFAVDGNTLRVAAMAKGAGMIGPNMATMLAVITTDARIDPDTAQALIRRVADRSFNNISVEGHTSTNDGLIMIASGRAQQRPLVGSFLKIFEDELTDVAIELAKKIPADGEGATHLVSISVHGADSDQTARIIAESIANSALVKTAIYGGDPNWGRIVSAAGYCGVELDPSQMSLEINGFTLFRNGQPIPFEAANVSQSMKENFETSLKLNIGQGTGQCEHWTSDLTVDYVKFNSEYTT